jgi:hypothetical protein
MFCTAVVDGHLFALALIPRVAVALVTELLKGKPSVHQDPWMHGLVSLAAALCWVKIGAGETATSNITFRNIYFQECPTDYDNNFPSLHTKLLYSITNMKTRNRNM